MPLAVIALAAFVVGAIVATSPGRAERRVVMDYARDWARGDYHGMYALLDSDSRAHMSQRKFTGAYTDAADTSTLTKLAIVNVGSRRGNMIPIQVLATTRLFGVLHETLEVPVVGSGSTVSVRFSRELLFPGMRPGERLHRQVDLAPRAALLASDGTPLAEGPGRTSPIPDVAGQIVGTVGSIPADEATGYAAQGYPPDATVGLDGMERIFQKQLAGTPGGSLMSGHRILALTPTKPGHSVHTTINPTIEHSAL